MAMSMLMSATCNTRFSDMIKLLKLGVCVAAICATTFTASSAIARNDRYETNESAEADDRYEANERDEADDRYETNERAEADDRYETNEREEDDDRYETNERDPN